MSSDKQIEEMATKMLIEVNRAGNEISFKNLAVALYNAGYRKTSEVAREIFEEIWNINAHGDGYYEYWKDWLAKLAELKKKYTEREKGNEETIR